MWGGKVACWSTKAAVCLKRVKIEEKLLWRAYKKSPTLFLMVSSTTLYDLLFLKAKCLFVAWYVKFFYLILQHN